MKASTKVICGGVALALGLAALFYALLFELDSRSIVSEVVAREAQAESIEASDHRRFMQLNATRMVRPSA